MTSSQQQPSFEYKIFDVVRGFTPSAKDMAFRYGELGKKGWELVTVVDAHDENGNTLYRAIFKRARPGPDNPP